jgi:murein DD-endopeptidase MepM/ murein hydrolase activator NlpD
MRRVVPLLVLALLAPILFGFVFSSHTRRVARPALVVPAASVELALERAAHVRQARRLSALHVAVPRLFPFDWPAAGSITGVYGWDAGRPHPGVDIGILRSLRVRAAAPGRILHAGYTRGFEGYGKVVVERVGRYTVLYGHLSRVAVHPGERVTRDEHVGTAGCTGWCTGTHLHFEVRRGRRTVNPMRMLAGAR